MGGREDQRGWLEQFFRGPLLYRHHHRYEVEVTTRAYVMDCGCWLGEGRHNRRNLGIIFGDHLAVIDVRRRSPAGARGRVLTAVPPTAEGPPEFTCEERWWRSAEEEIRYAEERRWDDSAYDIEWFVAILAYFTSTDIAIIANEQVNPWFADEVRTFWLTGADVWDAIVIVPDLHFGMRDRADDFAQDRDNLHYLAQVLAVLRTRLGVKRIVQAGDMYDVWECERELRSNVFVGGRLWARSKALEDHCGGEWVQSRIEEQWFAGPSQSASDTARFHGIRETLTSGVRGNHDWQGTQKTDALYYPDETGRERSIRIEHGHRYDPFNNTYKTGLHYGWDVILRVLNMMGGELIAARAIATIVPLFGYYLERKTLVRAQRLLDALLSRKQNEEVLRVIDALTENVSTRIEDHTAAPDDCIGRWITHCIAGSQRGGDPGDDRTTPSSTDTAKGAVPSPTLIEFAVNLQTLFGRMVLDKTIRKLFAQKLTMGRPALEEVPRVWVIGHTHHPGIFPVDLFKGKR